MTAAQWVHSFGKSVGRTRPMAALRIVMATNAPAAPTNTALLSCLIAKSAAMKKVLSPSSETTIMDVVVVNAAVSDAWWEASSCVTSIVAIMLIWQRRRDYRQKDIKRLNGTKKHSVVEIFEKQS
mmetsp:Transcript_20829/g.45149  ORF Transcript_20829/g.45149 Transcript_20829/m.45149 type:complete len:125 (+) Transcript_20829:437-811(+)